MTEDELIDARNAADPNWPYPGAKPEAEIVIEIRTDDPAHVIPSAVDHTQPTREEVKEWTREAMESCGVKSE